MWVAGIDRPYYPSVQFFDNEEAAKWHYLMLTGENEREGKYDCKVFYAHVSQLTNIKTDY